MMDSDSRTPDFEPEAVAANDQPATAPAEPSADELVAQLREENAKLRDERLRALAEVENVRRRAERDREETAKYAVSGFAKALLDVADNLGRALAHVPQDALANDPALASLAEGVAATERQLLAVFERHGVVRVDPQDQKFDPNFHEAMFEVPNSGKPAGTVVQVMQHGYVLHGRLLRPAMVGVAKGDPVAHVDRTA